MLNQKPNQRLHHLHCWRWAAGSYELMNGVDISAAECTVQLRHIKRIKEPDHANQSLRVKHIRHTAQLWHTTSENIWQWHPQLSIIFISLQQMHNKTYIVYSLQCFDTVAQAAGRASGPQKTWVMRCWRGYLSGASANNLHMVELMPLPFHHPCFRKSRMVYPSGTSLPGLSWKKGH